LARETASSVEPVGYGFNQFGIDPSAVPSEGTTTPDWLAPKPRKQPRPSRMPILRSKRATSLSHPVRELASSSPGKLAAVGLLLVLICLASGVITASAISVRQQHLDTVYMRTEPIASAAQSLYNALSIGDAAASAAFASGGLESPDQRQRYTRAMVDASRALVLASEGVGETDDEAQRLLSEIAVHLPIYSGLVETARTNNRSGNPVGAAYLNEASTMMRSTVLPIAEKLYQMKAAEVSNAHRDFSRPPWIAIGAVLVTLAALVAVQVKLSRKTRRTLNLGMLASTVAMGLVLVWLLGAGFISRAESNRAREQGAYPLQTLTTMRILAQQARADETLGLARRSEAAEIEAKFNETFTQLTEGLTALRDNSRVDIDESIMETAMDANERWREAHEQMNALYAAGKHLEAAVIAVGPGNEYSTAQFDRLDSALRDGIAETRAELRSAIENAHAVLTYAAQGALTLSLGACLGIALGLWPRLREYQ
jgi:hypothetical protein